MKINKYSDLIILILLWGITLYSVFVTQTTIYELTLKNFIAYSILVVITLLRTLKVRKIKTLLALTLLIASFNLISFIYKNYTLTFGITILSIKLNFLGIQPLSLVLLLFLLLTDIKRVMLILNKYFPSEKHNNNDYSSLKNMFLKKFKDYNINQLKDILDEKDKYQDEAVEAAKILLNKKT